MLQNALRTTANLRYCIFDLMALDGEDMRPLPLTERKERLKAILPEDRLLGFSGRRRTHGKRYFEEAKSQGLEGVMAKTARDALMHTLDKEYPDMAFRSTRAILSTSIWPLLRGSAPRLFIAAPSRPSARS